MAANTEDHAWKGPFLQHFRDSAIIRYAARQVGCSRSAVFKALKYDPEFAAAFEEARQDAVDLLELRAREIATTGTEVPIIHQGKVTGTYREISVATLHMLLKHHRPEVYGDKIAVENTGPGGGPIQVEHTIDLSVYSTEELVVLRDLLKRGDQAAIKNGKG